jgi:hypothetical protein
VFHREETFVTTELMRFPTEDGGEVLVEVDDEDPGFRPASTAGAIAEAKKAFERALDDVNGAAERALSVFRNGALRPDSIEIEFGVRFNAEVGAVIAKTSADGHLTVKLAWSSALPQPAAPPASTPA